MRTPNSALWRCAAAFSAAVLGACAFSSLTLQTVFPRSPLVWGWPELLLSAVLATYAISPGFTESVAFRRITISWPGYGSYSGPPGATTSVQPLVIVLAFVALWPAGYGMILLAGALLKPSLSVLALAFLGSAAVLIRLCSRSFRGLTDGRVAFYEGEPVKPSSSDEAGGG